MLVCFLYPDRAEARRNKSSTKSTKGLRDDFLFKKKMSFSYILLQRNVGKLDADPVSCVTFSNSVCVCVCACGHARKSSVLSDSSQPHGLQPTKLLYSWNFSRHKYWSGLSFLTPGDLPNPRIEPTSLLTPVLAGAFFTNGPPDPWAKPNSQRLSMPLMPTRGKRDIINTEENEIIHMDSLYFPENYSHKSYHFCTQSFFLLLKLLLASQLTNSNQV